MPFRSDDGFIPPREAKTPLPLLPAEGHEGVDTALADKKGLDSDEIAAGPLEWPSGAGMAEEDAIDEPQSGREDVETAGSGRSEEPNGAPNASAHDVDTKPPRPAKEDDQEAEFTLADGPKPGATGAYRAPGSGASTRRRDKKKKGRGGGLDGEPAMSVEDLFVTISTVQVCMAYYSVL